MGWVGGKKGVWGRGAGARHCTTLNVPLKVLPTSHFHQDSGHMNQRARSLDKMSYRKDFLFLLPTGGCSQWIIGCTFTFTRNSFRTETVYKVLMKAFLHKLFFLSEKWLPLNMPSQLHCVFDKMWMHKHFVLLLLDFSLCWPLFCVCSNIILAKTMWYEYLSTLPRMH